MCWLRFSGSSALKNQFPLYYIFLCTECKYKENSVSQFDTGGEIYHLVVIVSILLFLLNP